MKFKSDTTNLEMDFDTHDYGGNKGGDWRIYIKIPHFVTIDSESWSQFDFGARINNGAKITVEKMPIWANHQGFEPAREMDSSDPQKTHPYEGQTRFQWMIVTKSQRVW